jgi:hydroxymethylpyrimidine pyrophosphatase-like HAD family hydrolase
MHSRVFISYYNGAVTRRLSEDPPKPEGGLHHIDFEALIAQLKIDPFIARIAKPENKSFQLTLKAASQEEFPAASTAIRELVARQPKNRMRVVQSSHSLDVVPEESTKLNCVRLAQSHLVAGTEVLTIGDRGAISGNDYELLTHPFSLSVDTVSADLGSCWNLLPAGCRNVAGLGLYAAWFRVKSGCFTLSIPKTLC